MERNLKQEKGRGDENLKNTQLLDKIFRTASDQPHYSFK